MYVYCNVSMCIVMCVYCWVLSQPSVSLAPAPASVGGSALCSRRVSWRWPGRRCRAWRRGRRRARNIWRLWENKLTPDKRTFPSPLTRHHPNCLDLRRTRGDGGADGGQTLRLRLGSFCNLYLDHVGDNSSLSLRVGILFLVLWINSKTGITRIFFLYQGNFLKIKMWYIINKSRNHAIILKREQMNCSVC